MYREDEEQWAVIKPTSTGKVNALRISDYFDYEWGSFNTLKNDKGTVLFDTRSDVIGFVYDNFSEDMIDEEVKELRKLPDGYFW